MRKLGIVIIVILLLLFYSACNSKRDQIVGSTPEVMEIFDIPRLVNMNMIQVFKEIGQPDHVFDSDNLRWARYPRVLKNEYADMSIIYNPITNKIEFFMCSMNNAYSLEEFMTIANIDTLSNDYKVVLPKNSAVGSNGKYSWLSIYPLKPKMVFDIPTLLNKNIDELSELIGKNFSFKTPDRLLEEVDINKYATIEKGSYRLTVAFNPKSKKVNYFLLQILKNKGFEDAKDMLSVGNLVVNSRLYSTVFGHSVNLGNVFNSVTVYPKTQ